MISAVKRYRMVSLDAKVFNGWSHAIWFEQFDLNTIMWSRTAVEVAAIVLCHSCKGYRSQLLEKALWVISRRGGTSTHLGCKETSRVECMLQQV